MGIVGISGSPILNGNTDRLVERVLQRSGDEYKFLNLSALAFEPCRACAALCAKTNMCPVDDDLKPWYEPIRDATALVLGSPVYAGNVTAWMFSFIGRLWCFHHVRNLLADKPVILLVTGLFDHTCERALKRFALYFEDWGHKIRVVDAWHYVSSNPPCYRCGEGNICKVGGLWKMVGRDEEKLRNLKITRDLFNRWEECPATVARMERSGDLLAEIVGTIPHNNT